MDKFKIGHLVDYFMKVNKEGSSFKDLSQEDMLSLAILSIFDKGGKTVKTSSYSYERPNDVIDENEFNMTKKEYEKATKQIQKAIKKEVGKEFTALNIPTYEDLQAMMKDDKKVDFNEIHRFARDGVVKPTNTEKPKFHGIPQKTTTNFSVEQMQDFVAEIANNDYKYEVVEKFNNMSNAEYDNFVEKIKKYDAQLADVQTYINNFEPDKNVAYNKQNGVDGIQFNEDGQKIFRINGKAGVYESYKYESGKDTRFSEMVRYNANGYKTEYWKKMTYPNPENPSENLVGYFIYSLDENEKITKVSRFPSQFEFSEKYKDFNDFQLYQKYMRYYEELDRQGFFEDTPAQPNDSGIKETKVQVDPKTIK